MVAKSEDNKSQILLASLQNSQLCEKKRNIVDWQIELTFACLSLKLRSKVFLELKQCSHVEKTERKRRIRNTEMMLCSAKSCPEMPYGGTISQNTSLSTVSSNCFWVTTKVSKNFFMLCTFLIRAPKSFWISSSLRFWWLKVPRRKVQIYKSECASRVSVLGCGAGEKFFLKSAGRNKFF